MNHRPIASYTTNVLEQIANGVPVLGRNESFAIRRVAVLWLQLLGFPLRHVHKTRALPARALYPCGRKTRRRK